MTVAIINKLTNIIENHVFAVHESAKDSAYTYVDVPRKAIVRIGEIWDGNLFLAPVLLTKEEYIILVKENIPEINDETIDSLYTEYMENF
jgi:hypothetical protein